MCSKQQVSDEQDTPFRIVLPFKDHKSGNVFKSKKENTSLIAQSSGEFVYLDKLLYSFTKKVNVKNNNDVPTVRRSFSN